MRTQHLLPLLLVKDTPAPEKKKVVPRKGYFTRDTKGPVKLTDEQVIEARGRYEFQGWSCQRVADHYGLSRKYVDNLMRYATRSKLVPRQADFPPEQGVKTKGSAK